MFDKLQGIARLMIIPTVALYLCGFVCMTGYLARFGIVTFDIINARFLIAGMHALLPMSISVLLCWSVYKALLDRKVWTYDGAGERLALYAQLIITPTFLAICFNALYGVANFSKTSDPDAYKFGPLGSWDIVGRLLRFADFGFGYKLAFYLCIYPALVIVPLYALNLARKRRRKPSAPQTLAPAPPVLQTSSSVSPPVLGIIKLFIDGGVGARSIVMTIDVVAFGIMAGAFFYSGWRIRSELLDADTLSNLTFSSNLLLAWFYTTNFSILFFLVAIPATFAQLNFSNIVRWITPSNVADALNRLAAPVLASLFLFGATVFPRLPVAIGGGMPQQVSLSLKEPDHQFAVGKKYLLGESSQFLFIVQVNGRQRRAYQINKDAIEAVETWEDDLPPNPPKATSKPLPTMPQAKAKALHPAPTRRP